MSLHLRNFDGGCHCGAIGFSFQTAVPVAKWSVRACQCRFCRAHDALTTSDPAGRLVFLVRDPELLSRYRFNLKTADFLVCKRCGVYVGAQIATAHGAFGIINTLTLRPVPDGLPAAASGDYSSESPNERVARREKRWTPLDEWAAPNRQATTRMTPPEQVLQTERLVLRHLSVGDVPFILRLLNEPSWLENIGDKGVRTAADAQRYIETGPVEMYGRLGFGLYQVRLTASDEPIGMCGLLKRETLEHADLGFAFFPEFWGNGYAREAAAAVLSYARKKLGLARILAIIAPNNDASRRVLEKLGFELERSVHLEAGGEELLLYANGPVNALERSRSHPR